ncbi:nitroreductase family protein [Streptomyces albipurpureus]|uniref:Nitroreductase family protein n=1 Tax=Streptomyces albipurpureus TaxID=2897419 RepID=A0ABT0UFC5_9ACTN|nr:nitroreductase family protein [Streptomyces sp. CWNU-1]MCM2386735.1 nitroreductase family protein [Streptomyces sp. CWNU-1]
MPLINETELWPRTKRALAPADSPDERTSPGRPPAGDTSPISQGTALHDVLTARRSVRQFRKDPVVDTDLATILSLATSTDRQMWPRGTAETTPQAWLVSGLTGTSGVRLRQYTSKESRVGEHLVEEFTDHGDCAVLAPLAMRYVPAPVAVLICAGITDGTGANYTQALLRASAFGYNAWLAAVAAGLGGSVHGRSSPEVTRIVRRHSGTPARHLFTLVLGHPAEAPGRGPDRE